MSLWGRDSLFYEIGTINSNDIVMIIINRVFDSVEND